MQYGQTPGALIVYFVFYSFTQLAVDIHTLTTYSNHRDFENTNVVIVDANISIQSTIQIIYKRKILF